MAPAPTASEPVRWLLGAEAVFTVSSLPSPAMGPGLFGAIRYRRFTGYLAARYDLGASAPLQGGGDLRASLFTTTLHLCGSPRVGVRFELDLCALAAIGALSADATALDRSTPETTLYVGAGASVGVTLRLGVVFGLRLHGDLVANIVRARHTVLDASVVREVWLAPPAGGAIGLGLVANFG